MNTIPLSINGFKLTDTPELPVKEVTAIRDVAMSYVRENARSVKSNPYDRTHHFVLYDDSGGDVGSGLTDTFLSVAIKKPNFRHHRMRISFLELILTEERRYSNLREVFSFDWHDDDEVVSARRTVVERLGKIVSTGLNQDGIVSDLVVPKVEERLLPVAPEDCDILCDRMLEVTQNILQKAA